MLAVSDGGGGIPGDPAAVDAAAATLRAAAGQFTDTADSIGSHRRALVAEWTGTASDAASDHLDRLVTRTRVGTDVTASAAAVLEQYAATLRTAQSNYTAATSAAASASAAQSNAQNALAAAQTAGTAPAVVPGVSTTAVPASIPAGITAPDPAALSAATSALSTANAAASAAADATSDALALAAAADAQAAAAINALVSQLAAMGGTAAARGTSSNHGEHWWNSAWNATTSAVGHAAGDVTQWTEHAAQDAWRWTSQEAQGVGANAQSVVDYYQEHPDQLAKTVRDSAETALGFVIIGAGVGDETVGVLADVTVVGAVVGVPMNIAGVGIITAGAGLAIDGGSKLAGDMDTLNEGRVVPSRADDMSRMDRSLAERMKDPGWKARPGNSNGSAPATPAGGQPYDPAVADRVPEWGVRDVKTRGTFAAGGGATRVEQDLTSGQTSVVNDLPQPRPGMNRFTKTHVEAQAAAIMRQDGLKEGTLYINRLPCGPGSTAGCDYLLPRMVPKGSTLTVYGPDGLARVVVGEG